MFIEEDKKELLDMLDDTTVDDMSFSSLKLESVMDNIKHKKEINKIYDTVNEKYDDEYYDDYIEESMEIINILGNKIKNEFATNEYLKHTISESTESNNTKDNMLCNIRDEHMHNIIDLYGNTYFTKEDVDLSDEYIYKTLAFESADDISYVDKGEHLINVINNTDYSNYNNIKLIDLFIEAYNNPDTIIPTISQYVNEGIISKNVEDSYIATL